MYPLRFRFTQSTLRRSISHQNGIPTQIVPTKRSRIQSIALYAGASSALTMGLYVLVQLSNHKDGHNTNIFLPLWMNLNWLGPNRYPFYRGLRYFDHDIYRHFETCPLDLRDFEYTNVRYELLEQLSQNVAIRQNFGLPLQLHPNPEKFQIWVETKGPSVSGVRITYDSGSFRGSGWWVKPIDTEGLKEGASMMLNHMENEPLAEIHSLNSQPKGFHIRFCGQMHIVGKGTVDYHGILDVGHLGMNRGVKVTGFQVHKTSSSNGDQNVCHKGEK